MPNVSSVTVTNVSVDTINPSPCQLTTEVYTSRMSTKATLAERMEALRNELGLTQEALAERGRASGLTRVQVVHVEGGRNQMNSKIICERYPQALWVTKEELYRFINSEQDPAELAQKIIKRGPPPWTTLDQPAAVGTWGAHPMWEEALEGHHERVHCWANKLNMDHDEPDAWIGTMVWTADCLSSLPRWWVDLVAEVSWMY